MIESATVHKNFLGDHKKLLFSYDFGVSGIVHFLFLKYPMNCAVMKKGIAISQPPSTYLF